MIGFRCNLFILLVLSVGAFGQGQNDTNPDWDQEYIEDDPLDPVIVQGQRVESGEIPFHAFLVERRTNGRAFQCGGSLLRPTWVFTAAHCIRSEGATTEVRLGGTDRRNMAYSQMADMRIMHEDFGVTPAENDVGLVRLPVAAMMGPEIAVVALAQDSVGPLEGMALRASGWGNVQTGGPSSNHLLKIQLQGISNEECSQTYGSRIKSSTICAGPPAGEMQNTCQGDSGGPLALVQNGEAVVVGVVSFGQSSGRGGCEAGDPTAFARASSFRQWADDNMDRNAA